MPAIFIPHIRLLNPGVIPIFSRIFPRQLKYQCLERKLGPPVLPTQQQLQQLGVRRFSTRLARSGPGSSAGVRASKTLIDDEAELSDWVGGLRSDSLNTRLYSDGDSDDNRDSSRGRGRGRGERGGRDRDFSAKRRRHDDSDDYTISDRQYGGRNSELGYGRDRGGGSRGASGGYGGGSRGGRGGYGGGLRRGGSSSGRGGFASSDDEGFVSRRKENDSMVAERGGRYSELGYGRERGGGSRGGPGGYGGGSSRGGGGSRGSRGGYGGGSGVYGRDRGGGSRGGRRGYGGGLNRGGNSSGRGGLADSDEDEGFVSRQRENGFRGRNDSMVAERDGRGSELGYGRDPGGGSRRGGGGDGRGLNKGGKSLAIARSVASYEESDIDDDDDDEEEEEEEEEEEGQEKLMKGFSDFISEEDSEEEEEEDDGEEEEVNAGSLFASNNKASSYLQAVPTSPGRSDSYLSETRFDQCSVSPLSLKGIKDAGYEKMTVVQEATLPVILKGRDVLAKAKTGTGKTVAFLLPSIEVVVKSPPVGHDQKRPPIIVLVICPTRELASQAAAEAKTLLKYHPSIGVQVVIGGTRLPQEQKRMQANPCQILVATPGRLKDHIENTPGFATRLMGVKVLVLDEADHLLDMGFRKDIERIIAAVPKQRQTLLFSATVPDEVRQVCHVALKRDHEFIDTVGEGTEQTHSQVRQTHLVAPLDNHFPFLYALLKEHISDDVDYKVLVFCTTAMVTRLVADLLGELNLNVREIHSRKSQGYRTKVSDEFRKSKGLILVTSDVSARGVDYPDVTLVIQVGLPSDRAQYIHRLGRTGRKGKEGQGILLLAPWEEFFLSAIKDLPLTKAPVPLVDSETRKKVERALSHVEMKNKEAAYQAWLGYYNSNKTVGRDKGRLVELANEFSQSMGLDNPPAIPKLVLGKMGLKNVPGLRTR